MEFNIIITDEQMVEMIKPILVREINKTINYVVDKQLGKYHQDIQDKVETYLAKRLTDEDIKKLINDTAKTLIEERLEREY